MERSIFTGYYGMKNYGDDLFGVVASHAATHYWGAKSVVLGPPILGCASSFSVPSFVPSDIYAANSFAGKFLRTAFSARELLRNGRLVFCGGSLFSSNRSRFMDLAEWTARRRRRRYAAIGVSIGPFECSESERAVRSFLQCFDYVSVRDRASFEKLESYGLGASIALGRDLAGLAPMVFGPRTKAKNERPIIGYAPCAMPDAQRSKRYDDLFIEGISQYRRIASVRLFILNAHRELGDAERVAYVQQRLVEAGCLVELVDYDRVSVEQVWRSIASCDAMVSVRLHGAITAYMTDVPFILFEYHRKCSDFLDDIGQPVERRSLLAGAPDAEELEGFRRNLAALFHGGSEPAIPPSLYAKESARHFSQAPWVKDHG